MELRCPECMGVLELREDSTARCTIHGGEFQVLFARQGISAAAYAAPSSLPGAGTALAAGLRCVQHSHLQATAQCKSCGAYMCDTCAFDVGGGIKVCPACAASPKTTLSPKRKKFLIGSFAFAIWCTLTFVLLMAGAFSHINLGNAQDTDQAVGTLLILFVVIPSIIGLGLGVSSMERRQKTPMATWIAIVWNGIILGGFFLLMIIGLIMKGGG